MRLRDPPRDRLHATTSPASRADPDAAADAARPRRPVSSLNWRIDIDATGRLAGATDPFGNLIHTFTVDGPLDGLTITRRGRGRDQDTNGIVRGQVERCPGSRLPARDAARPRADDGDPRLRRGDVAARPGADPARHPARASWPRIHDGCRFDVDATDTGTSAAEAFACGHGVCQDFAHIFIAAARHLGIPARYVGGYLYRARPASTRSQEAGHAWAEAWSTDLGWVGFDPANGICPTEAYVRVAVGLDYLGAAPVRGTRYGGAGESPRRQGRSSSDTARGGEAMTRALLPLPAGPASPEIPRLGIRERGDQP